MSVRAEPAIRRRRRVTSGAARPGAGWIALVGSLRRTPLSMPERCRETCSRSCRPRGQSTARALRFRRAMPASDHRELRAARRATQAFFLVAGIGIASWAPMVPFAKARLALDDARLGLILLCLGLGAA